MFISLKPTSLLHYRKIFFSFYFYKILVTVFSTCSFCNRCNLPFYLKNKLSDNFKKVINKEVYRNINKPPLLLLLIPILTQPLFFLNAQSPLDLLPVQHNYPG